MKYKIKVVSELSGLLARFTVCKVVEGLVKPLVLRQGVTLKGLINDFGLDESQIQACRELDPLRAESIEFVIGSEPECDPDASQLQRQALALLRSKGYECEIGPDADSVAVSDPLRCQRGSRVWVEYELVIIHLSGALKKVREFLVERE